MFCPKCGNEQLKVTKFCIHCGTNIETLGSEKVKESTTERQASPLSPPPIQANTPTGEINATGVNEPLSALIENLGILQRRISKSGAFLGVLVGFAVFAFTLFLTWSSIPPGIRAIDGGAVTGWEEKAYLAILPLAISLYPVFQQRAVGIKNLLVNIILAFALLGYNNLINRTKWEHSYYGSNLGSDLGAGFWIGLLAIATISVCGIAWALHTKNEVKS